jgi:hypothetical protein
MANTAKGPDQEGLVGQASAQVQEAASTAQEKAVELKEQGKSKLADTLEQRTNEAGVQTRKLAQALRRSGEQLGDHGDGQQIAGVAEGAADRMERLGDYLANARGDDLLRDFEDFARRRPWLVAGAGLIAGLAASRFLKASSERRFEATGLQGGYGRYGYSTSSGTRGPYTEEGLAGPAYATSG